ncbi:tyrosine-protein phosphatase [Geodermatophilus sp. URMC 64]
MTSLRIDRWLRLDGTTNTRDLGGLPTTDGGTTVPGRILRSDNLQTLSEADVARLVDELKVREVIDLRTSGEILLEGRGPLRAVPDVVHRHFGLIPERGHYTDVFAVEEDDVPDLPAGWQASVLPRQTAEGDEQESPAVRSYLGYLNDRGENVVAALRALAHGGPGAAVVHCAAGKDRTGVIVALSLAVAGVPHDEIVADYAMTAEIIDALVAKLAASPTYAEDMERDVARHTPRAETMDRVLTLLDERHGGPLGWLEAHGFGAADQAALRSRLRD